MKVEDVYDGESIDNNIDNCNKEIDNGLCKISLCFIDLLICRNFQNNIQVIKEIVNNLGNVNQKV